MKRWLTMVFIVAVALPLSGSSTPPKSVTLSWDAAAGSLKVVADHYTLAHSVHFIKTIAVEVDGKPVVTRTMTSQADARNQVVEIPLAGVGPGAKIKVTCLCSLYGSGTAEMVAP